MKSGDEDDLWREIVENYGKTASFDEVAGSDPLPEATSADALDELPLDPTPEPTPASPLDSWADEGRFVPPTPPPIPWPAPRRLAAWAGVFVAPILVLLSVVVPVDYPGWFVLLLIAWCTGGFVYLVATMPRGGRDPWDDGSRI